MLRTCIHGNKTNATLQINHYSYGSNHVKSGVRIFFPADFKSNPLVSALLLRTDAPVSIGAARKGEGKVNRLIGMSTIPHTYLTPKPWELQPKSDTFLGEENSQAVKSSIYCQLQCLISIFWPWVSQYFSSTFRTFSLIFQQDSFLVVRSWEALCNDLIPLFIHTGISCINYGPLIVLEIRNRSSASNLFCVSPEKLIILKGGVGGVGGVGAAPVRGQWPLCSWCLRSTGVYAVLWH